MQVAVLKLDINDNAKRKQKAMEIASTRPGVDSVAIDMKEQKRTITGNMDTIDVVNNLRKALKVEIVSVRPVKKPEKIEEKTNDPARPGFNYAPCCNYPPCPWYYSG